MPDDRSELPNSRVLLQQNAIARVHEAAALLNEALANAASLGLRAEVSVQVKKRDTHRTPDGSMDDISLTTSDAEAPAVHVRFADPRPTATVTAMRA
jgi:hypothetical protein